MHKKSLTGFAKSHSKFSISIINSNDDLVFNMNLFYLAYIFLVWFEDLELSESDMKWRRFKSAIGLLNYYYVNAPAHSCLA